MAPLLTEMESSTTKIPFAHATPMLDSLLSSERTVMTVPTATIAPPSSSLSTNDPPSQHNQAQRLDDSTIATLQQQGYSLGLAQSLNSVKSSFAKRIFIIDNSGSMQRNDGHRLVDVKERGVIKIVPCTRWEEVCESIRYHIQLTGLIQAPTSFRLLNHPGAAAGSQLFSVAEGNPTNIASDVENALQIINRTRPGGCTPLTDHVRAIQTEVSEMAPELRAQGQRVSITICTDGLPSDPYGHGGPEHNRAFVQSLRQLEGLPIWIVIRLCTDEDKVVDFYNNLDNQLEVSVEVLDDFTGEAQEVHQCNPWLNYGLPLHRLRELGFHDRAFDMLDERALTQTELRDFCGLLFGQDKMDGVPDPSADWVGFRNAVQQLMASEKPQWNPRSKRMEPWLDVKMLDFLYGDACGHLPCHPLQLFQMMKFFRCA